LFVPETNTMRWPTLFLCFFVLATAAFAAPPQIEPVAGLRDRTPRVQALVGGKVVQRPGKVLENGTVLIRDGVIIGSVKKSNCRPKRAFGM
jgi:hypothetical protein